ncbi:hypothetical protein [Hymenobacter busanensis]|uniref:hypothetical protein n=1 Tax=Hymenobacter busanensis TaxID=2607656 RepID=UPI003B848305
MADKETDELLSVHIIGPRIAEAVTVMGYQALTARRAAGEHDSYLLPAPEAATFTPLGTSGLPIRVPMPCLSRRSASPTPRPTCWPTPKASP